MHPVLKLAVPLRPPPGDTQWFSLERKILGNHALFAEVGKLGPEGETHLSIPSWDPPANRQPRGVDAAGSSTLLALSLTTYKALGRKSGSQLASGGPVLGPGGAGGEEKGAPPAHSHAGQDPGLPGMGGQGGGPGCRAGAGRSG